MATTVTDRFSESPQSLWPRGRVRVATTANITLATDLQAGDVIDGVTLATADLVLVKNQTTQADNGIYRAGDGGARAPGFQTFNDIAGNTFSVLEGTTNGDTTWQCTANYGGTLGTTALTFTQFDGGSALGALDSDTGRFIVGVGSSFQSKTPAQVRAILGDPIDELATLGSPGAPRLIGLDNDTGGTVRIYAPGSGIVFDDTGGVQSDLATAAQFRANTALKVLSTDQVWSSSAEVTLTDAATIAVDMSTFINAVVTLTDNRTLGQPSNTKVGQSGCIRIIQNAVGSKTLAYHADWKFAFGTDPTLSTASNAQDLLFYQVVAANYIFASLVKAVA